MVFPILARIDHIQENRKGDALLKCGCHCGKSERNTPLKAHTPNEGTEMLFFLLDFRGNLSNIGAYSGCLNGGCLVCVCVLSQGDLAHIYADWDQCVPTPDRARLYQLLARPDLSCSDGISTVDPQSLQNLAPNAHNLLFPDSAISSPSKQSHKSIFVNLQTDKFEVFLIFMWSPHDSGFSPTLRACYQPTLYSWQKWQTKTWKCTVCQKWLKLDLKVGLSMEYNVFYVVET